MTSSTATSRQQIFQLDYPILLKLFPGYGRRKQTLKGDYPAMREWIHRMASILARVDDYIHDNLNNTSEFAVYYDKDFVQREEFPFEQFVHDVVQTKQWSRVPPVQKQRKQQIQKRMTDATMKRKYQDLVDQWYWIQLHISVLRMIFENFVRNDDRLNQQIKKLLPVNNRGVYKHFWFPVKHETMPPPSPSSKQQQKTKSKSVDQLLRQSLSPPPPPPSRRSVRIRAKSSKQGEPS